MPEKAAEIIGILTEDHDRVLALFAEFHRIKERADDQARQALVEAACTELVIHAHVEEEYLYPALREALDRLDPVEEAEVEHMIATHLINQLEAMQAGDALYDARFTVLGEYVKHHIAQEQAVIFPLIRTAGLEFDTLAQDIIQRRNELRSEFGMPDQYYEDGGYNFPLHPRPHSRH